MLSHPAPEICQSHGGSMPPRCLAPSSPRRRVASHAPNPGVRTSPGRDSSHRAHTAASPYTPEGHWAPHRPARVPSTSWRRRPGRCLRGLYKPKPKSERDADSVRLGWPTVVRPRDCHHHDRLRARERGDVSDACRLLRSTSRGSRCPGQSPRLQVAAANRRRIPHGVAAVFDSLRRRPASGCRTMRHHRRRAEMSRVRPRDGHAGRRPQRRP